MLILWVVISESRTIREKLTSPMRGDPALPSFPLPGAYPSAIAGVSSLTEERRDSFPVKGVYKPRFFFPHATLLRQAFAHCGRFLTAASRRSLGRVSVPMWLVILSNQLPIVALVSRYPPN
jgi:hypothetical protein